MSLVVLGRADADRSMGPKAVPRHPVGGGVTQWWLIHREVWLGGRKRQHGWHEQQGTTIRGRGDNGRQHRAGTRAALESMG